MEISKKLQLNIRYLPEYGEKQHPIYPEITAFFNDFSVILVERLQVGLKS